MPRMPCEEPGTMRDAERVPCRRRCGETVRMGGSPFWRPSGRTGMTQGRKITVIVLAAVGIVSTPLIWLLNNPDAERWPTPPSKPPSASWPWFGPCCSTRPRLAPQTRPAEPGRPPAAASPVSDDRVAGARRGHSRAYGRGQRHGLRLWHRLLELGPAHPWRKHHQAKRGTRRPSHR